MGGINPPTRGGEHLYTTLVGGGVTPHPATGGVNICTPGQMYTWTNVHLDKCTPGRMYTWTGVHHPGGGWRYPPPSQGGGEHMYTTRRIPSAQVARPVGPARWPDGSRPGGSRPGGPGGPSARRPVGSWPRWPRWPGGSWPRWPRPPRWPGGSWPRRAVDPGPVARRAVARWQWWPGGPADVRF